MHTVQMFWPTVLAHKIDCESPLWDMSARDLASNAAKNMFEIVLTFEGTTPETGNTVQVRVDIVDIISRELNNISTSVNTQWKSIDAESTSFSTVCKTDGRDSTFKG